MFGADWLANLFLGTFLFGLIFTAGSLLLGVIDLGGLGGGHGGAHVGHFDVASDAGGLDAGGADGAGPDGQDLAGHDGPGLFNIPTIMAALTWFGGVGYILKKTVGLGGEVAIVLAVLSGVVGGAIMFVLLARVLWPMMSKPMLSSDYRLPGTPARVVSSIRAGGVGEIVYVKNGTRFTAGAAGSNGEPIPRGTEVVILSYEKGIAQVQDIEATLRGSG